MSAPFVPGQTGLIGYLKSVQLTDRSGKPFTKLVIEVGMEQWADAPALSRLRCQMVCLYMESIPGETALRLTHSDISGQTDAPPLRAAQ